MSELPIFCRLKNSFRPLNAERNKKRELNETGEFTANRLDVLKYL